MSYKIDRRVRLELFDLSDVSKAEAALTEFLLGFTEPGWSFQYFSSKPLALTVLATFDEITAQYDK